MVMRGKLRRTFSCFVIASELHRAASTYSGEQRRRLGLKMNNRPGGEAVIAVCEERARIGGVEAVKKTLVAATDEGVIAVQVNSVERPGGYGYRPALPAPRYQPTPAITYRRDPSCTDYCCLACDSEYEWYKLEGKGCFWIPFLLLFYLVVGAVILPFLILYLLCLCICYPLGCCKNNDDDLDRPLFTA